MDKYFDDYNPDLLPLIPPDAKVILEVGCGTGKLCEAYRRINPGVEWWGIENNIEAANIATENHGVEIIGWDVECWSWVFNEGRQVDCVVFGDVLEHLRDPWRVLKNLTLWLKPSGQVLASVPNVQHWSVILNLLRGQWRYEDDGLLDRTHLRFFTLEGIKEMFRAAGLQTFDIRGRQIGFNPEAEAARDRLLASGFGEVFGGPEFVRQSMAYQYLVRAIRSEATVPKLHIHAIGDGTICERPRLHEPMAMLATIPGVRTSTHSQFRVSVSHPFPANEDAVLILQRERAIKGRDHYLEGVQRLLSNYSRCLLIAEIDDDPEWLVGLPECDFLPLRAVHAIQTTTEVMAETCRRFNPHVAVFPNQIASLPPLRTFDPSPMEINLFFGALNREADWAPIMSALNRVLNDHSHVTMNVIHDRKFFDAIETSRKQFFPFCQWPEYRGILSQCDIALLPLEDNRVNRHKSDIKFIECAAEGVAVLASETVYAETAFHSSRGAKLIIIPTMMIYNRPDQFERVLRSLITTPELRRELAVNAHAYVRNHRLLSQHYRRRHEWYLDLLSRKAELTRDLFQRIPSLCPHSSEPALVGSRPVPEASPA